MPQCIYCGSWDVGSREKWTNRLDCWCKDCGKTWQINKNEKNHDFVIFDRAQCPKCGSHETGAREKSNSMMRVFTFKMRYDCWCKQCGNIWQINDDELDKNFYDSD
jgi:Zn finger protein HypA/HybF involved in hydrogenase expression